MNIFSNIGITELLLILLLALLVVGPERLPEFARRLGKLLRDARNAYDNLTRDLGPELASLQRTTQELRESVESVRSIPQDAVKSVVKTAELDETIAELKTVKDEVGQIGQTLNDAGKAIKDPVGTVVRTTKGAVLPTETDKPEREEVADISESAAESAALPTETAKAEGEEVADISETETEIADATQAEQGDE
jgi:sec-independent protein translocase protein TatB